MEFDSDEEMYFYWWLEDLTKKGYIREYLFQPKPILLSSQLSVDFFTPYKKKEGGKLTSEEILSGHVYTPDVYILWDDSAIDLFTTPLYSDKRKKKNRSFQSIICQETHIRTDKYADLNIGDAAYYSIVEVKPKFDQNNMTRLAKINIKWVWEKKRIFVNIIIPEKHFEKTFTPSRFFFTNKSGKPRKIKYNPVRTLEQFIKL